jgi:hypothetical protein
MKRMFGLLFLLWLPPLSHAQEAQTLYSIVSGSVVYVQHEILLNSGDCTKPELCRRSENLTKWHVLDVPLPLMSGSGFFADAEGIILEVGDLDTFRGEVVKAVSKGLDERFTSNLPGRPPAKTLVLYTPS